MKAKLGGMCIFFGDSAKFRKMLFVVNILIIKWFSVFVMCNLTKNNYC